MYTLYIYLAQNANGTQFYRVKLGLKGVYCITFIILFLLKITKAG